VRVREGSVVSSARTQRGSASPLVDIVLGRDVCGDLEAAESREWLVTNGIGGYASGTVSSLLTRRYHAILMAALNPPVGRTLLVSKLDETVAYDGRDYPLFANRWADGTVDPHGYRHIECFALENAIPRWEFACADAILQKRVWMEQGANTTYVRYDLARASGPLTLTVKALVNHRADHGATRGNAWIMTVVPVPHGVRVHPFPGATPFVIAARGASVEPAHAWHTGFDLSLERERGLDHHDDHLHVATFLITLECGQSVTVVASAEGNPVLNGGTAITRRRAADEDVRERWRSARPKRADRPREWVERLVLAADQFVVQRNAKGATHGRTVIAGYHWFGDWGRDAMIALPGLTLATGRPDVARAILATFAQYVDRGMLPNRFPDTGQVPEYNTVDAALWYVEAVRAYHGATGDDRTLRELFPVLADIISWYTKGTRHGIVADATDGLLMAGEPSVQLTWMDAKVGDRVVTQRAGKPVEVNALWYNAARAMAGFARQLGRSPQPYDQLADRAHAGFARFWNGATGYCYDVVDGPQGHDASLRPNQLLAVSLPESPLTKEQQRAVVEICARRLLTSHGLRSLSPDHPDYVARYVGDAMSRDAAYHQGTVWGWLLGPFALSHLRVYRDPATALAFLEPIARHLSVAGVGSLSEIFDGDPPFAPRGCIAQAWTVAEVLRAWCEVDAFRSRTERTAIGAQNSTRTKGHSS
jgi:predicted glycogen debranching enzyme